MATVMKEKFNFWTIEALINKIFCLHTEHHKHGGLTKKKKNRSADTYGLTTPLTCGRALNYTGSPVNNIIVIQVPVRLSHCHYSNHFLYSHDCNASFSRDIRCWSLIEFKGLRHREVHFRLCVKPAYQTGLLICWD